MRFVFVLFFCFGVMGLFVLVLFVKYLFYCIDCTKKGGSILPPLLFFCSLSCFIKVWAKFCNLIRLVYCTLFCVYCWNGLFVAVFVDVFCDSLVVNCWNECYNLYPKA